MTVKGFRFLRRFVEVPSTWEGWVMRVLTIAVVITLAASIMTWMQIAQVRDIIDQRGAVRQAQYEQLSTQTCALLREHDVPLTQMKALGCSS